jgi:hypothetical protein
MSIGKEWWSEAEVGILSPSVTAGKVYGFVPIIRHNVSFRL